MHAWQVTLLFTYSGITDDRIEPIAKSETTVKSIRTAAGLKNRTGVGGTGQVSAGCLPPSSDHRSNS